MQHQAIENISTFVHNFSISHLCKCVCVCVFVCVCEQKYYVKRIIIISTSCTSLKMLYWGNDKLLQKEEILLRYPKFKTTNTGGGGGGLFLLVVRNYLSFIFVGN